MTTGGSYCHCKILLN